MKIRIGFVSNSSSSSFCIYGARFEDKLSADICEKAEAIGLGVQYRTDHYYSTYIGRELKSMLRNQTREDFEKEIEAKIEELFCKPMACAIHEKAWYDG